MIFRAFLIPLLLAFAEVAGSATGGDGYNEVTIRSSDIPSDAPRFSDFPADLYTGPNAAPNLRHDARARMHRTRLAHWAKEPPNFAGHYILATWGCGTDCTQIAIIDAKTGAIFHPVGVTYNVATNVQRELLEGGDLWHSSGAVKFRADSRLLVLIGMPEERTSDRGISYYEWVGNQLKPVRFVPKPWYSGRP